MELKIELEQSSQSCFTCLRQSEECMPISSEANNPDSMTIIELLTKHFWFQQDDFIEQQHVICWSCWNRLDEFHRFYQEVEQNHQTLNQDPPKLSGCKVEPKIMDDGDSNFVDEIQHDEVELKEEHWVESEEEGSDKGFNPESSSDEENGEEGDCDSEDSPLGKGLPRHRIAKQESWIGEPSDSRHANKPVGHSKQWADDDEFIKTHVQYICLVCNNNCPTFSHHKNHMMNVHNMRGCITCCGKKFYKKHVLLDHVQRLQDPDRFKCDVCHKMLTNSRSLQKHKREKHATDDEKIYRCDRCPRRFVMASQLNHHLKEHENLDKGAFTCPHCEKPFPARSLMNKHVKHSHAPRYANICDVCGKGFFSKLDFLRHKEQHEFSAEELRVQCEICHKWLKNKLSWRKHYRHHTAPTVPCDICGHVALNAVALWNHKHKQHLTEPSFVCQKCGKKFQRANELQKHSILHYEGTLYSCNFCDKKFIHQGSMKTHQRIKHPKEWSEQNNEAKDAHPVANSA